MGSPNPALPFVHKEGLELIQAEYASQAEAAAKITAGWTTSTSTQYPAVWSGQRGAVEAAAQSLVAIYKRNVFPEMKVTWGTYPSGMGHSAPGHNPIAGMLPLPRREPYVEGREDDHERLQRLPQPAGRGRQKSQGADGSGDAIERRTALAADLSA